jgi:phage terminase large subunit GpA-like protein
MANPGPDASFQLGRLYAPTFPFGDYARSFVRAAQGDDALMQNFMNSWAGFPWMQKRFRAEWQDVAASLTTDLPAGIIPNDAIFVTVGVDVQVDHYVYVVVAWRKDQSGAVIAYGVVPHRVGLADEVLDTLWPFEDGKERACAVMTLVDSGYEPENVQADCRAVNRHKRWVWPSMGSRQGNLQGQSFKKSRLDTDQSARSTNRHSLRNLFLVMVNTPYWQSWLHRCLYMRKPGTPNSLTVHAGSLEDQDFWQQLMNEQPADKIDSSGHIKSFWEVVDETVDVDFRDALRYARCAAEVYTNKAWNRLTDRRIGVQRVTVPRQKDQPQGNRKPKKWINRTITMRRHAR